MAFGLCVLSLGCKSILSVQYVVYNDPVFLVLTCIVWITGELLSFLASITALKLRLYERRDEEVTRSKLSKIDKYLKRHDYHEYLEVEGVKRHFLLFNKNWIIENLHRILTREDFLEENSRLMKLYKHYESEAKKKQIAKRRIGRESRQPSKQQSGAHMQGQVVIKLPLAKF